jgi:hypothetical protein
MSGLCGCRALYFSYAYTFLKSVYLGIAFTVKYGQGVPEIIAGTVMSTVLLAGIPKKGLR